MAERKPLVRLQGRIAQLPDGDWLPMRGAQWASLSTDGQGALDVRAIQGQAVYLNAVAAPHNTLRRIRGGLGGQQLLLRLTTGLHVTHGSPLRLLNARSLNATTDQVDGNKVLNLLCLSGAGTPGSENVWVEIGRNWQTAQPLEQSGVAALQSLPLMSGSGNTGIYMLQFPQAFANAPEVQVTQVRLSGARHLNRLEVCNLTNNYMLLCTDLAAGCFVHWRARERTS